MWRWTELIACCALGLLWSAVAADEPAAGMVWQVPGERNNLYLVGSVHMLRQSDFPLSGNIESAYDDAEILVMELDMDDLDPLEIQALFFEYGRLPEGQTLEQIMGASQWRAARESASELGIELAMLNKVKPWWAAITIVQLQLTRLGFDPQWGLEGYFTRRAASDQKPIEGLETAAYQISLFDSMDMERQKEMLVKSLQDAATLEQDMSEMLSAWRAGEIGQLAGLQDETFRDFPGLYVSLIKARNENWVRGLAQLLDDEQDYLVVVGALHLVGEHSVIRGLQSLGYEVARK